MKHVAFFILAVFFASISFGQIKPTTAASTQPSPPVPANVSVTPAVAATPFSQASPAVVVVTPIPTVPPKFSPIMTDALDKAIKSSGDDVTYTKLVELGQKPGKLTFGSSGVFTLANILIIVGAFLGMFAVLYLAKPFLAKMSPKIHEITIFSLSIIGLMMASHTRPEIQLFVILPCSLAIFFCIVSFKDHYFTNDESLLNGSMIYTVTAVIWAAIAILFHSQVIGFMSVFAFFVSIGFSSIVTPGVVAIGFDNKEAVARGTFSALILLVIYVLGIFIWKAMPMAYQYFSVGFGWLGTFIYFLGLLIVSSKWYTKNNDNYWVMQLLMLLSIGASIYLGTSYGITLLAGIGGTIMVIYILEKYIEIPWGKQWATGLLGSAGLLYGIAWIMKHNPQIFLWGI